jgi:hypothetical protein
MAESFAVVSWKCAIRSVRRVLFVSSLLGPFTGAHWGVGLNEGPGAHCQDGADSLKKPLHIGALLSMDSVLCYMFIATGRKLSPKVDRRSGCAGRAPGPIGHRKKLLFSDVDVA